MLHNNKKERHQRKAGEVKYDPSSQLNDRNPGKECKAMVTRGTEIGQPKVELCRKLARNLLKIIFFCNVKVLINYF